MCEGAFTGAYRDNPGLLRQGTAGPSFLDEVGEMSLRMQALLLRFLETGEITARRRDGEQQSRGRSYRRGHQSRPRGGGVVARVP